MTIRDELGNDLTACYCIIGTSGHSIVRVSQPAEKIRQFAPHMHLGYVDCHDEGNSSFPIHSKILGNFSTGSLGQVTPKVAAWCPLQGPEGDADSGAKPNPGPRIEKLG